MIPMHAMFFIAVVFTFVLLMLFFTLVSEVNVVINTIPID